MLRHALIPLLLATAAPALAQTPPADGPVRTFTPQDMFRLSVGTRF